MNKSCVVNFANGAWYPRGQQRLYQTIMQHTDRSYPFDFLAINNYDDIQCPRHDQLPYAFKYKSVEKAAAMGYVNILWLDCSMYAIKAIDPIFRHLEKYGYAVTWSEFNNAQWTNDAMLEHFSMSRDDAEKTRHIYSGCIGYHTKYENIQSSCADTRIRFHFFGEAGTIRISPNRKTLDVAVIDMIKVL